MNFDDKILKARVTGLDHLALLTLEFSTKMKTKVLLSDFDDSVMRF